MSSYELRRSNNDITKFDRNTKKDDNNKKKSNCDKDSSIPDVVIKWFNGVDREKNPNDKHKEHLCHQQSNNPPQHRRGEQEQPVVIKTFCIRNLNQCVQGRRNPRNK